MPFKGVRISWLMFERNSVRATASARTWIDCLMNR